MSSSSESATARPVTLGSNFSSKSATNSPDIPQKLPVTISPSSLSASNSPRFLRSSKYNFGTHKNHLFEHDQSRRKLLSDGGQPRIAVMTPSISKTNGTATMNSDSRSSQIVAAARNNEDGKRTPPWKHLTTPAASRSATLSSRNYQNWRSHSQHLRLPNSGNSISLRSLKATGTPEDKSAHLVASALSPSLRSFTSELPANTSKPLSDVQSVRSLVSIGMGSTDGKRIMIRRVPTSPLELLNIANPPPNTGNNTPEDEEGETRFSSLSTLSDPHAEFDFHHFRHHHHHHHRYHHHCKPGRHRWSNKLQFVLASVGYSLGLGTLWRLPYMCYKSEGGIFFVPYFLILLICGMPLLYMELAIGQFTKRGPIAALSKLCPLFKGIGVSSVAISFFLSTYYNVVISYALFYLFSSFRSHPPWQNCANKWNTAECWKNFMMLENRTRSASSKTPAEEFYVKKVLQASGGVHESGEMRWELVVCLFVLWTVVYFSLWKSVRSSGRVLYVTATLPFFLVLVFLCYSLSFDGAEDGMKYLFSPNWQLLLDSKVWMNAAAQNLNSLGVAFGCAITFSSYNKYNNNILQDTVVITILNAAASLLVAMLAFSTIGSIAFEQHKSIDDVVTDGPGLAFVVYPEALSKMPFMGFSSVLFFSTFFCLGLNNQFAIVEVIVTSVMDGFPNWVKKHLVCHEVLVLLICIVSFFIGLSYVCQGGIYFFQLLDYYVASIAIVFVAFIEVVAIAWIYGTSALSCNIEKMTGKKPPLFFIYCWKIASPIFLMCVWLFSLVDFEPLTYNNEQYKYPIGAQIFGWLITFLILSCIPIMLTLVIIYSPGNTFFEKLSNAVKFRERSDNNNSRYPYMMAEEVAKTTEEKEHLNTLLEENTPPATEIPYPSPQHSPVVIVKASQTVIEDR